MGVLRCPIRRSCEVTSQPVMPGNEMSQQEDIRLVLFCEFQALLGHRTRRRTIKPSGERISFIISRWSRLVVHGDNCEATALVTVYTLHAGWFLRRGMRCRQHHFHVEGAARAVGAFDRDFTTQYLGQQLGDRETKPGSRGRLATWFMDAFEWAKNPLHVIGADVRVRKSSTMKFGDFAAIPHRECHMAGISVFDGVGQ